MKLTSKYVLVLLISFLQNYPRLFQFLWLSPEQIPVGSRSGDRLVMRGKGIVKSNGLHGFEYVHLDVEIPKYVANQRQNIFVFLGEFLAFD